MRKSAFAFLRATYWRWAETILDVCPDLRDAPEVLAIGDTHLENFGTWRDAEARLVWGANDFDDAAIMPYPLDLARLAASALLALGDGPTPREVCDALLTGYADGLADPVPIVLERGHKWLREAVVLPEGERAAFWRKFEALTPDAAPPRYEDALRAAMPDPAAPFVISRRTAGTGSLGRPRFVARSDWRGGPVLREAKAVVASAWSLRHAPGPYATRSGVIAAGRFRAPDPHFHVADGIAVRRLSPNNRKLGVKEEAEKLFAAEMLEAMGREVANCQADDLDRLPALREDLARRGKDWLLQAASAAADGVAREHAEFA